jgi:peptidoglycan/LPS O-acetylase OafA/YrhL
MRYIKSLDGLRAVAVLLVMAFHFGYIGFGWIGVQIFFVLSGYLITQILIDQKSLPTNLYMGRFYWRRTLRIFPLFYAFLFGFTVLYLVFGEPEEFGRLAKYFYTYTYNYARMFPEDPGGGAVSHLWSLAVEEQFYLVWPLVVLFLPPKWFKRTVVALLVLIPLFRVALALWGATWAVNDDHIGRIVYVFTLSHFDAFATGAALSLFSFDFIKRPARAFYIALAALVVIGFVNDYSLWAQGWVSPWQFEASIATEDSCFLGDLGNGYLNHLCFNRTLGYPIHMYNNGQHVWGYTLINLVSALAILASKRGQPIAAGLENRWMVRWGQVSYGLYVFHAPLLIFLHRAVPYNHLTLAGVGIFIVYCLVVWGVSELSFHLFEKWFIRHKDWYDKRNGIVKEKGLITVRPKINALAERPK